MPRPRRLRMPRPRRGEMAKACAGRRARVWLLTLTLQPWLLAGAQAQTADSRRIALEPYASLEEVLTDNYRLAASDSGTDAITRMTAGVSARARSGDLTGRVNLAANQLLYARHGQENSSWLSLDTLGSLQLLDRRLRIDGGATVTRSQVSALSSSGSQTSELASDDTSLVRSWQLQPVAQGPLGRSMVYEAGLSWSGTDVEDGQSGGDQRVQRLRLSLQPREAAVLSWRIDATSQHNRYGQQRRSTSDQRAYGTLVYQAVPLDLSLRAGLGYELSNLSTVDKQAAGTRSVGLNWTPSPRTAVDASLEQRQFGHGHNLSAQHRFRRLLVRLTSRRAISSDEDGQLGTVGDGSLFALYMAQLQNVEPDLSKRVELAVNLIQQQGLNPTDRASGDWLAGATVVTQDDRLSVAWTGQRSTAELQIGQSRSERIDPLATSIDALGQLSRRRARSAELTLSHRLTPQSRMVVGWSWQQVSAQAQAPKSREQIARLTWSTDLGPRVTAGLGARWGLYDQGASDYAERALTATLGARF